LTDNAFLSSWRRGFLKLDAKQCGPAISTSLHYTLKVLQPSYNRSCDEIFFTSVVMSELGILHFVFPYFVTTYAPVDSSISVVTVFTTA